MGVSPIPLLTIRNHSEEIHTNAFCVLQSLFCQKWTGQRADNWPSGTTVRCVWWPSLILCVTMEHHLPGGMLRSQLGAMWPQQRQLWAAGAAPPEQSNHITRVIQPLWALAEFLRAFCIPSWVWSRPAKKLHNLRGITCCSTLTRKKAWILHSLQTWLGEEKGEADIIVLCLFSPHCAGLWGSGRVTAVVVTWKVNYGNMLMRVWAGWHTGERRQMVH